jgi:hypothetical protein
VLSVIGNFDLEMQAPLTGNVIQGAMSLVGHPGMSVAVRLTKETLYQNQKRWMLNRLVLGTGVVCGLGVDVDPQNSGMILVVQPGVALDGLGREGCSSCPGLSESVSANGQ